MALIKCPECGRNITDTNEICIHCGCPVTKKKDKKKKIIPVIVGFCVVVAIVIGLLLNGGIDSLVPHTIQNTELMKLLEYTNPSEIKSELGNDYEHNTYDSLNSSSDDYEDITIDSKVYSKVEITYDSSGAFERIYLDTEAIWSQKEYETLIADLIEQYGKDYDYEEDEYNGRAIYDYTWDIGFPRRVSCAIHADSDDESKYWIRINSFHN